MKNMQVYEEDVKKKSCDRRFELGKTSYRSNVETRFPVVLKTTKDDFIKKEVTANMTDSEEVTLLCRREMVKDLRTTFNFTKDKLEFKDTMKSVDLMVSEDGHMLARLELVGKWNDDDAVSSVKKMILVREQVELVLMRSSCSTELLELGQLEESIWSIANTADA